MLDWEEPTFALYTWLERTDGRIGAGGSPRQELIVFISGLWIRLHQHAALRCKQAHFWATDENFDWMLVSVQSLDVKT